MGNSMRKYHRYLAVFAILFGLYISVTGLLTQGVDLKAILSDAPANDPTMRAIRVGIYGPPNFQVIGERDFTAPPLPAGVDYQAALPAVVSNARSAIGAGPINFVEFRTLAGRPVAEVASGKRVFTFDVATGAGVAPPHPLVLATMEAPSWRNTLKAIHRFRIYGRWGILIDLGAGILILAMLYTGGMTYWQLLKQRRRLKRPNPFWQAGGWWRTLHRATALVAALFVAVLAITGSLLSISSIGVALQAGVRPMITADYSRPLTDAELPAMLKTTLGAWQRDHPGRPIRALRLRIFAGMPQGVIVTGGGEADQVVYDAGTGREVSLTEPNYPAPGQTFGWQADETMKEIHRGDYFGLTGRWMNLLSGVALLYLSVSGAMIYLELWKLRRKRGRHGLFWSP